MPKTNVTVELKGNASSLTSAGRTALRTLRRIGAATRQISRIGGAAGLVAGAGLAKIGVDAAKSVDSVVKLSENLNTTNSEVQQLQLAGRLSGVGSEQITKGFQQVVRVLGDAKRGLKSAEDAFADAGIALDSLDTTKPAEALAKIATGLNSIEDPAKRASVASVLFGRQWRSMAPLLNNAEQTFGRAAFVFDELDLGLKGSADSVASLKDNFEILTTIGTALRDKVFVTLAPLIDEQIVKVGQLVEAWIKAEGGGTELAKTLANDVVGGVQKVIRFIQAAAPVIKAFAFVLEKAVQGLRFLGQLGGAVAAAGVQAAQGNFSGADAILSQDLGDVYEQANPGTLRGTEAEGAVSRELNEQTGLLAQILEAVQAQQLGSTFQ